MIASVRLPERPPLYLHLPKLVAALLLAFAATVPAIAEPVSSSKTSGGRSAWLWDDLVWRQHADALLTQAQDLKIGTLYITLEIRNDQVRHAAALRTFLRKAHGRGVSVLAVEGDPHFVFPDGRAHAVARAKVIRAWQASARTGEQLDGLQYDIEPYVLPDFSVDDPDDLAAWRDTFRALRRAYGQRLDIVFPFWVANTPRGANFVRQTAADARSYATMAYRTTVPRIIDAATPLLDLGTELNRPVRVALENGPTSEGPGVSFEGDLPALLKAMKQARPTLAAKPGFGGFAIHGITWPGQTRSTTPRGKETP